MTGGSGFLSDLAFVCVLGVGYHKQLILMISARKVDIPLTT